MNMRCLTPDEILRLEQSGSVAEDWAKVSVSDDFSPQQVLACRFSGRVEIGSGATLSDSTICSYRIGSGTVIRNVTALECRKESSFGNGVSVAAVNENGGRSVFIFDRMTAQMAYFAAMYRHRTKSVERINGWARSRAEECRSAMGSVGNNTVIIGAKFISEVDIRDNVRIEGASLLENGTILPGAYVGVDVKATDFIITEGAKVDLGATLTRCFVGEAATISRGFSAVDSLFFANSHCENGEACSLFAGPYTVSHHKSSLLIAGIFSFFNAGSGTNQSNHLFKSGAVHQAVHLRGCRFGSNAYVMAPAAEGAFTTVIGRHTKHHDTTALPFSYLIENNGVSTLMPAFALRNCGTVRDIAKWSKRDHRTLCREHISFAEYNPYMAGMAIKGVEVLKALKAKDHDAQQYAYNNTVIKSSMLSLGIKLYEQYITASLGAMLHGSTPIKGGEGAWVDAAGAYLPKSKVEALLDNLDRGDYSAAEFASQLDNLSADFASYACGWALDTLAQRLGHTPSEEEVAQIISEGEKIHTALREVAESDRKRDCGEDMSTGYGIDTDCHEERMADFAAVRDL